MDTTFDPGMIYDVFEKYGFPVLRIDLFDRGNYAELRAELDYSDFLTIEQLQEIVVKLRLIEQNENIEIKIVNIDMRHRSLRMNIYTLE